MTPRTLLVTGGTGFLGAALVRRLVTDGHDVRVLDNNVRGASRRLADMAQTLEFVEGDVRDMETVFKAMSGVDVVVHLAAINGTEFFYSKPELVLDVGVRGMLTIIDACRAHGVGELIVASSSEVQSTFVDFDIVAAGGPVRIAATLPSRCQDATSGNESVRRHMLPKQLVASRSTRRDWLRFVK